MLAQIGMSCIGLCPFTQGIPRTFSIGRFIRKSKLRPPFGNGDPYRFLSSFWARFSARESSAASCFPFLSILERLPLRRALLITIGVGAGILPLALPRSLPPHRLPHRFRSAISPNWWSSARREVGMRSRCSSPQPGKPRLSKSVFIPTKVSSVSFEERFNSNFRLMVLSPRGLRFPAIMSGEAPIARPSPLIMIRRIRCLPRLIPILRSSFGLAIPLRLRIPIPR